MKIKHNKKDNFGHPASEEIEISAELQLEFRTLGKMAGSLSPKPLNPIQIPEQRSFVFRYATPVMACSLALLLIFFTYTVNTTSVTNELVNLETIYQEIENDEIFMAEVDSLVEEVAYSYFYPETTTVESKYDFSDDFIEVIVPI